MLVLAQVTPGAAGPQQTKEELEEAKKRVKAVTGEVEDARAHLDRINAELQEATTLASQLSSQVEALRAAIAEVRKQRNKARREIEGLQGNLNDRARAAYINGGASALELVLEAESLANLTDRLSYLEALSQSDSDLVTGIEVERERLDRYQQDLEGYVEELRPLLEEARARTAELAEKQQAAQDAEAALQAKLAEAEELVDKLEKKYKKELAAQLAAARAAAAASGSGTGGGPPLKADGPLYHCPVDPPRSYIDDFGFPRVGHTHQGNDIFAPYGTPIRAPFEGTAQESYNGLGGTSVHVYSSNGTGDYVYNAHLSRHAGVDGQHVTPGKLIGYVGDSGNAQGTSPHDHFEYHPGGGSAVSPYNYLNEVCGVGGAG
ncbi:MAG: murein hydrolase activator EnvC family protein [Actinomycetota bacterium]